MTPQFLALDPRLRVLCARDTAVAAIVAADREAVWSSEIRSLRATPGAHPEIRIVHITRLGDSGRTVAVRTHGHWYGPAVDAGLGYLVTPELDALHAARVNRPPTPGLLLCWACAAVANGDDMAVDNEDWASQVERGLSRIAAIAALRPDYDESTERGILRSVTRRCDCCRATETGRYRRFAVQESPWNEEYYRFAIGEAP